MTDIEASRKFKIGNQFVDRRGIGKGRDAGVEARCAELAASATGLYVRTAIQFDAAAAAAFAEPR